MNAKTSVLDHGYIEVVESWGSDESIIAAARMSTSGSFQGWGPFLKCENCGDSFDGPERPCPHPTGREYVDSGRGGHIFREQAGDEKLLAYLWSHKHASPFEMAGMVVEVQAPIFVFREWRTHRTCSQVADEYEMDDCFPGDCSYNEASARYTPLPDVNYMPSVERLMVNSKTNRQAGVVKGAAELTEAGAEHYRQSLEAHYSHCETLYQRALASGVPKELARIHLPFGRYSKMRASANLRNWVAYLTLRMDESAQYEIRVYANALAEMLRERFPKTMQLFLPAQGSS